MKKKNLAAVALSVCSFLFAVILAVVGVFALVLGDEGAMRALGVALLLAGGSTVAALTILWRRIHGRAAASRGPVAPPDSYKAEYMRYMDARGLKYRDAGERAVDVSYTASNADTLLVRVIFDGDDSGHVHFICGDIGSFRDKVPEGLLICNAMNMNFRWAKFYLNQQNNVVVDADAIIDGNLVGPACAEIVERLVDIIDKAYPEFMKAKWGQYDS